MGKPKFEFGIEFQELILQYTVTDQKGYKALELYEDSYFTTLHHAIIAHGLKKYYKKKKKVADEPILKEIIRVLYIKGKETFAALTASDRSTVDRIINRIYSRPLNDPGEVLDKIVNFARYIKFKEELEKIDINKFDSYESSIKNLRSANNLGSQIQEDYGVFIVKDMPERAHNRDKLSQIFPTPIWQWNKLSNSGGFNPGTVIMVAAEAKRFKTGFLINVGRLYMRRKKKVLYFDFENGAQALTLRTEQSLIKRDQASIISGDLDNHLLKLMRKYRRLGSEFVIKRMRAYKDTTDDCQNVIDKLKQEFGITFDVCVFDYPDVMASRSGQKDEVHRISDAYVDIKELADINKFECTWTASHVTREAAKRRGTRYQAGDLAKCIDKIRHVDIAIGIQETPEEMKAGMMRLEIIEQRNGTANGNMLFWVDIEKQGMTEFSRAQVKEYRDQVHEEIQTKERVSDL